MKDSILKGTGNSRFLKSAIPEGTTWAEALAMLRAGTFPMDLNGINNAGFQQVGTPLNKANLLRDVNALTLGLTGDAVPNDMFNVLAHAGDLHVWKKTVKNAEDIPAGYTLGEVQNVTKYPITDVRSGGYTIVTKAYSNLSVDDAGNVSVDESSYVNFYNDVSAVRGKFIQVYSDSAILFIPNDANISTDYKTVGSAVIHNHYTDKYQSVTGYPLTPAGTTVTYPVSTNRNACQEGNDAKPAGYTLGEVVTGKYILGWVAPGNTDIKIDVSSALTVSDSGEVSMSNPSIGQSFNTATSDLLGKFIRANTYGITSSNTQGYQLPSGIIHIPSTATIKNEVIPSISSSSQWITIDRYQPVTGYAAIPANTTIEYLGCLGEKTRMQVVSYVGTGTYGSSNPNSLTFDFAPKLVMLLYLKGTWHGGLQGGSNFYSAYTLLWPTSYTQYVGFGSNSDDSSGLYGKKSTDGKTLYWYDSRGQQLNTSGNEYVFLGDWIKKGECLTMYYINTQGPNHGNPVSTPFPNSVPLPDTLLMDYINTKGFCTLTVQDGAVTALVVDQEALDAYNAEHPDVEPEKPVTVEELLAALLGEEVNKNG